MQFPIILQFCTRNQWQIIRFSGLVSIYVERIPVIVRYGGIHKVQLIETTRDLRARGLALQADNSRRVGVSRSRPLLHQDLLHYNEASKEWRCNTAGGLQMSVWHHYRIHKAYYKTLKGAVLYTFDTNISSHFPVHINPREAQTCR